MNSSGSIDMTDSISMKKSKVKKSKIKNSMSKDSNNNNNVPINNINSNDNNKGMRASIFKKQSSGNVEIKVL